MPRLIRQGGRCGAESHAFTVRWAVIGAWYVLDPVAATAQSCMLLL